jgi:RND family efflux transporter MFP subunit
MFRKISEFSCNHKKLVVLIVLILAFTAFRLLTVSAAPFQVSFEPEPVYVELGEAQFGTMRELGLYYGTLTPPNRFTLASKVGGEIREIYVDIGDQLNSGELVAQINDEEYLLVMDRAKLNVSLAEAQLSEAQANLELAISDMARQTNLSQKSIVSQSEFETVQNKLRQAEARLMVAKSQLAAATNQLADSELKLSYTQVTATWPGDETKGKKLRYVGRRLVDSGDLVTANTPLIELVSLDPLLVVVEVIEKDYPKLHVGMEASARVEAFPGVIFRGKILRIAPILSPDTRQARVELEILNPNLMLKPGMFAEVVFVFDERQGVWSVDDNVPFRKQDGYVIFVAHPSTSQVEEIRIGLGIKEGSRVEIITPKPIDGPVVVLGQHLLQDGQSYRLPNASLPASSLAPPERGKLPS